MIASPRLVAHTVSVLRDAGCVFAEDEADLLIAHAADDTALEALVARRTDGVPLEVILGWTSFCGLRIEIDPGVFVPRQRTAFLVEQGVSRTRHGATVVDLCCGSGAVGRALAEQVPGVVLHAADLDPVAVACATRNLGPVGGRAVCGDLFAALPPELRGTVDVVVVNAPYVPTDEIALMPPEARDHEPRAALDGGADGVEIHRRVAVEVGDWLRPGGYVLIETSPGQADLTTTALADAGLATDLASSDEFFATVAIGRRV
ncbi:putative protein N(5)-glutamine methyltransferase [Gordonia sp. CPCC 206044]|uniref:putative protein N(5)-glutamine methyltransferase n=1 Tax=Gordonia sp. CPCC 206044 TaxID=3140793 RepID=UPI003AF3A5DA